ncbi:MAG: hypothetical protein ACERKS_11550, partial [Candidatus Bathyarchaeota archaeon]
MFKIDLWRKKMGSNGIDRKWSMYVLPIVLIAASIGVYYLVLKPNSIASRGGVEGIITDELGRALSGLRVSIIDGSVGFPEIAVSTSENGYYHIGSIPQGAFT